MPEVVFFFFSVSQDVFVPTQSLEPPQQSDKKLPCVTESQHLESASFSLPLQLSVNTENSCPAKQTSEQIEEDSQATQIEELEEPPGVDTSDSVMSRCDQSGQSNGATSESQTANSLKASTSAESLERRSECARTEQASPSPRTAAALNVHNVNVKDRAVSPADAVSCSQPRLDSSDLTVNSCVQETPSDATPCTLPSQSIISQTPAVDAVKTSVDAGGEKSQPADSQQRGTVGDSQTDREAMDECEQGNAEEEEAVMEAEESAGGGGASAMALALSQSQLLTPEPMEEDGEDGGADGDSVIVVTDSERDTQTLTKDGAPQAKTNSSQPIRDNVSASTNGHESQARAKGVNVDPDRFSQTERAGPEADGIKDKSLSDSSGGKLMMS